MKDKIVLAFNAFFLHLALLNFIDKVDRFPTLPFWAALFAVLLFSALIVFMLRSMQRSFLK